MPIQNPSTNDFIRLLTEHQIPIKGLILSMSPGCQDVNDILQDINVVLWEKKNSYTVGTDFKAWVYAIGRIKVMQYWDHQCKLGKMVLSNEFLESVAEASATDSSGYLEDKLETLSRCLASLKQEAQRGQETKRTREDKDRQTVEKAINIFALHRFFRSCDFSN